MGGLGVGGGRGRVGVECLLDTWLGIGAKLTP